MSSYDDETITIQINNYMNINSESTNSESTNSEVMNSESTNSKIMENDNMNNTLICPICLEELQTEFINACDCKNPYHNDCLLTWIDYKQSIECEICKSYYNIPNHILLKYISKMEHTSNNIEIRYYERSDDERSVDEISVDEGSLDEDRQQMRNYKYIKHMLSFCCMISVLFLFFLCGVYMFTR